MFVDSAYRSHRLFLLTSVALCALSGPALGQKAEETIEFDTITVEAESDDILVQDGYIAESGRIGVIPQHLRQHHADPQRRPELQ